MMKGKYKIRVNTPGESRLAQEIMFEKGADWLGGDKLPSFLEQPYLFLDGKRITWSDDGRWFDRQIHKEINLRGLLGLLSGVPKNYRA